MARDLGAPPCKYRQICCLVHYTSSRSAGANKVVGRKILGYGEAQKHIYTPIPLVGEQYSSFIRHVFIVHFFHSLAKKTSDVFDHSIQVVFSLKNVEKDGETQVGFFVEPKPVKCVKHRVEILQSSIGVIGFG